MRGLYWQDIRNGLPKGNQYYYYIRSEYHCLAEFDLVIECIEFIMNARCGIESGLEYATAVRAVDHITFRIIPPMRSSGD